MRWELAESRRVLAEKLARPIPYLAWPGGSYDDAMIRIATEVGYTTLFTIDDGVNRPGTDPLRLHRTIVHGGCDIRACAQILRDGIYRDCGAAAAVTERKRSTGK